MTSGFLKIDADISRALKRIDGLERATGGVMRNALNDAAFAARKAVMQEVGSQLTAKPWIKRGVLVEKATRENLTATVYIAAPQAKYLRENITGGARGLKAFEDRLRAAGLLGSNERAVPGSALPLDAYGSPRRAALVRILQAIGAGAAAPARRTRGARARGVFVVREQRGRLTRGVWESRPGSVAPLLLFVTDIPTYRPVVRFREFALDAARQEWAPAVKRHAARLIGAK